MNKRCLTAIRRYQTAVCRSLDAGGAALKAHVEIHNPLSLNTTAAFAHWVNVPMVPVSETRYRSGVIDPKWGDFPGLRQLRDTHALTECPHGAWVSGWRSTHVGLGSHWRPLT